MEGGEGELQCAKINYSPPKSPRSGVTFHKMFFDQLFDFLVVITKHAFKEHWEVEVALPTQSKIDFQKV